MKPAKNNIKNLSKNKRRIFKLLLIAIGVIFALLTAEIFLRIMGYSNPMFYKTDLTRGYALSPNIKGIYRKEGKSNVEINSDGLRDDEHQVVKPPETIRIAILGDSYTEALQVNLDETFWKIMQGKLHECRAFGGKNIEIINFGVSGYGTAQELITLREKVWKYSPDLVILAVTTNNDITDNLRHFKKTEIPYFVYRGNRLELDESFRESKTFQFNNTILSKAGGWLRDNLRVVQAILEVQIYLKYKISEWKNKPAGNSQNALQMLALQQQEAPKVEDIGIDHQIYRIPKDEYWNDAWRVTEGLFLSMNEEVKNKGAKFLILTLSNGGQVHPNPAARETFAKRVGADDLVYPDKRIKDFAESHGINVLTLAPELQTYSEKNQVYLHGFGTDIGNGHWNQAGHRATGEILANKICQGILK